MSSATALSSPEAIHPFSREGGGDAWTREPSMDIGGVVASWAGSTGWTPVLTRALRIRASARHHDATKRIIKPFQISAAAPARADPRSSANPLSGILGGGPIAAIFRARLRLTIPGNPTQRRSTPPPIRLISPAPRGDAADQFHSDDRAENPTPNPLVQPEVGAAQQRTHPRLTARLLPSLPVPRSRYGAFPGPLALRSAGTLGVRIQTDFEVPAPVASTWMFSAQVAN